MKKLVMIRSLILILFLINVMGSNIEEKNKYFKDDLNNIKQGTKLKHVSLYQNNKKYKKLNDKYNSNRYIPPHKISTPHENFLVESLEVFEKKYELIKSRNYFCLLMEQKLKFIIRHKLQVCSLVQNAIISLIKPYLFSECSITTNDSTSDYASLSDLTTEKTSSVDLLYYKPTKWNAQLIFPVLPYRVFRSLKWYFLDLTNIPRKMFFVDSGEFTLFYKCYLLFGPNTKELIFMGIKWNFVKFLKFSGEKMTHIFFIRLNDALYLHPDQQYLPKFIEYVFVESTDINYIDFRKGTTVDNFTIILSNDQKIQWDHIFLPQVTKYLRIQGPFTFFNKSFYLYEGKELEYLQHAERVRELIFESIYIQKLDLSRFINLEVVTFQNCHFSNTKNLKISDHIIVNIIKVNNDDSKNWWFNTNFTHLRLHFFHIIEIVPEILQYPESLNAFELIFSHQIEYKIINWYENLTVKNLPHLHVFTLFFSENCFTENPLWEIKEQLKNKTLELKSFSSLRQFNIICQSIQKHSEYNLSAFVKDVEDKLHNSLQEIRYTYLKDDNLSYQTQIWRNNEWVIEFRDEPDTVLEIRDRLYQKHY